MKTIPLIGFVVSVLAWAMVDGVGAENAGRSSAPPPALYRGIAAGEFMKTWLVLGPIPGAGPSADESAQKAAFKQDPFEAGGGVQNIRPTVDHAVAIAGKGYRWRKFVSPGGTNDLTEANPSPVPSMAYAWAEIEMKHAASRSLGIGSDGAVKVWLNGEVVHDKWAKRWIREDDDRVELALKKGRNQLLLKLQQNRRGPWRFVCRPLSASGLQAKLVEAAGRGDLPTVEELLARRVRVNGQDKSGLTPWQAARIHGHRNVAELLQRRGAKPRLPARPEKVIDATMRRLLPEGQSGVAVLVARAGKILFEKGYGLANLEHRVPVTPETKFRIGSISKQFTAAAILKLQEEGKLNLEDKLTKFMPEFPRGDEVTIHQLLTHTSGIHSYTGKPGFLETVALPVKADDLIQSFKDDPYDFDPGKKWSYNNSGYFLLGRIVEKVSGKSYEEFLRVTFFEPLGMTNTGLHHASAVLGHEAQGYAFEGGTMKKALNWDMSRAGGAGALFSTVEDLFRWNEALFHGRVLSQASLKAAFTPVTTAEQPEETPDGGYGCGWAVGTIRGLRKIHHSGGLNGFLSNLLRIPSEELTIVVLANASPVPPGLDPTALSNEFAQLYAAEKMEWRPQILADKTIPATTLEAYAGRYDYGSGTLTVTREGSRLFAQFGGEEKYEIFPKTETEFFWQVVDATVTFVKDAQGAVVKLIHRGAGVGVIHAPRLSNQTAITLSAEELDAYVGRYDYGGPGAILTVTREGDHLFAQLTGQTRFEIFPKSATEFFWKAVEARITFVKDEKGKVIKGTHEQNGRRFDAPRME